ncbi:MAG TPA: nucleoside triphosphate pyrophosphatase [Solirubrobacterales bacterium]|nr:nucleoside triphosphate pyrophosphatase [Solirubrobacterales bacterium]
MVPRAVLRVTLASGSPQRREILEKLGLEFDVVVPGVEELTSGDPEKLVRLNALRKAGALWEGGMPARANNVLGMPPSPPDRVVIACDTDVVLDGEVLGKPADEAEARAYLDRMSGRAHTVMSGLVVVADGEERVGIEKTTVVFKELSDAEKERYVAFGEWEGRSGGYAIQTLGSSLVARVEGSVSNVVGLPVGLLAELAPELFERG